MTFSPLSRAVRRRAVASVLSVGTAALLLTGCSSAGSSSTSAPVDTGPVAPLSIIAPNSDVSAVANLFLAQNLGYFDDENVDINIVVGSGAAGASLLVSGQGDLILAPTTVGLPLVAQGQSLSVIFSDVGAGLGAAVAVPTDSPIQSVQGLSGKKIGVNGTTGLSYGFANYLSQQIVSAGGQALQIVAFNDSATELNALTSGGIDAASATTGNFADLLASGKVRLVVDTSDESVRTKLLGTDYTIDTAYSGLADDVSSKHESIVRLLAALTRANAYLHTHTPDEIAAILVKDPNFSALSTDSIARAITARMPFYTPNNGYITEPAWEATLDWFTLWNIPTLGAVNQNPAYSYQNVVDMSYLTEAQDRLGPDALAPTATPSASK